jgi:hypothetical protein
LEDNIKMNLKCVGKLWTVIIRLRRERETSGGSVALSLLRSYCIVVVKVSYCQRLICKGISPIGNGCCS